jgi:DNA end-binding protein Ku
VKVLRNLVLRLGEVAIPVGLASSVSEKETSFRLLHSKPDCLAPTSLRAYCAADGWMLSPDETVTAWEVAPGQFIQLDDDELAALRPADSHLVEISGFIPAEQLDPLLVKKRYHLAPSKSFVGQRPYRALAEAMHELDVVALTRFAQWSTEQLGAISSRGIVLELATLRFLEDLVQADEIADTLGDVTIAAGEHDLMAEVVSRYTRALKPDDLASEQRPRVRHLLEAKLAGEKIKAAIDDVAAKDEPQPVDLEAALRRTLKGAPKKRRTAAAR